MVEIADINDRKSLLAWLEKSKQPQGPCVALAHRAAMRLMPVVLGYVTQNRQQSATPALRALLVSGVTAGAPQALLVEAGHDRVRSAAALAGSAYADTWEEANSGNAANSGAAYATIAAYAAANAAAYAVDALNEAANAASLVASAGAYTDAEANAFDANATASTAWSALRHDCEVIADGSDLASQPLWPAIPVTIIDLWANSQPFRQREGWQFWTNCYERALAGKPQPWPALLEIALQKDEFWKGSDSEVMARIDEVVARFEFLDMEIEPDPPTDNSKFAVDQDAVLQLQARVAAVHPALTYNAHAVLAQIARFQDEVRSDNLLSVEHPDFRANLIDFLDRLAASFEVLLKALPEPAEEVSEKAARATLTWRERFTCGLAIELNAFTTPEAMAKTAVPAGLIFGLAGIGALLGGPLGFGAGALVGKFISGEMKAGALADDIEEMVARDANGSDS